MTTVISPAAMRHWLSRVCRKLYRDAIPRGEFFSLFSIRSPDSPYIQVTVSLVMWYVWLDLGLRLILSAWQLIKHAGMALTLTLHVGIWVLTSVLSASRRQVDDWSRLERECGDLPIVLYDPYFARSAVVYWLLGIAAFLISDDKHSRLESVLLVVPFLVVLAMLLFAPKHLAYPDAAAGVLRVRILRSTKSELMLGSAEDVTRHRHYRLAPLLQLGDFSRDPDRVAVHRWQWMRLEGLSLETKSRVESFVLESVLLGALSFSAFVTIMSSSFKPDFEVALLHAQFGATISLVVWSLVRMAPIDVFASAFASVTPFAVLAPLTILCAFAYMFVLSARGRISNFAMKLDYLLRVMATHLDELQRLRDLGADHTDRIKKSSEQWEAQHEKLDAVSADAEALSYRISFEMEILSMFRRAGFFLFLLILITCAGMISASAAFTALLASVFVYQVLSSGRILRASERLYFRH